MYTRKILIAIGFLLSGILNGYGQIEIYSKAQALDSAINSNCDEYNVVLSPDDSHLFFTRAHHPENIGGRDDPGDIWVSEVSINGQWEVPVNVKSLNDEGINAILGFIDPRTVLVRTKKGLVTFYQFNGKWFESSVLEIPYFRQKSDHLSGSLSHDGNFLVLGMESFGTRGVEDIYFSQKRKDGTWTSLKNLGGVINSKYQEVTPFLASDNKTLFFATNGQGGYGSFDIFMSQRLDDTWLNWSEPVNLGDKVNTLGQEYSFAFSAESTEAYLISTQNSEGYGDIKKVQIKPHIDEPDAVTPPAGITIALADSIDTKAIVTEKSFIKLIGTVLNHKTKKPMQGVKISLSQVGGDNVVAGITDANGKYSLLVSQGVNYTLKASIGYFFPYRDEVFIGLKELFDYSFELEPIIEGNTVALDHVFFEQSKAILKSESETELNLVVEMMKDNPKVNIFLGGHTDNQGRASSNIKLSNDRVDAVKKYLVSKGVNKKRITGKGYGGMKPRASNADPETRKLNRRVEITVHIRD